MADQIKLTIEITTGHCLGGVGNDVYPGRVLVAPKDLSVADAWKKVRMGYARIIPNATEPGPDPESAPPGPAPVIHGDPAVTSRDPEIESSETTASPAHRGRLQGLRPVRAGGR